LLRARTFVGAVGKLVLIAAGLPQFAKYCKVPWYTERAI
jgi:hypothetical protein